MAEPDSLTAPFLASARILSRRWAIPDGGPSPGVLRLTGTRGCKNPSGGSGTSESQWEEERSPAGRSPPKTGSVWPGSGAGMGRGWARGERGLGGMVTVGDAGLVRDAERARDVSCASSFLRARSCGEVLVGREGGTELAKEKGVVYEVSESGVEWVSVRVAAMCRRGGRVRARPSVGEEVRR